MTGPKSGMVNDPLFFNGFTFLTGANNGNNVVSFNVPVVIDYANHTAMINGIQSSYTNFIFIPAQPLTGSIAGDVSQILMQPLVNSSATMILNDAYSSADSIDNMVNDIYWQYDHYLKNVKVDPFCGYTATGY